MHNGKFQKNSQNIKNIKKKYHYGFISSFLVGKIRERAKIKIIVPFRFYPMHNGKFQRNSQKMKNIKKIPLWLHFKLLGWKSPSTSENKNYRSVSFLPDA